MGKNAPEDSILKVDQLSLGLADISLDSAQNDGGDWELGMDFHASAMKNKLKIFRDSINKMKEYLEKLQQQEQEREMVKQSNGNSSNNEENSGMKKKEISWDQLLDRFQVKQIEEAELSEMLIKGDALHGFTDERKKREGWMSDSEVIKLLCGHSD